MYKPLRRVEHADTLDLPQFRRRLADRVRALRRSRGLRQEDLEDYGLSWKAVQKLEYGATDPKVSTLLKLCRAFDVSLVDLLDFERRARARRR